MAFKDDPRLIEAQAIPISEIVERLDISGLHRSGAESVGPCPVCQGKDRFGVNTQRGVFNCRRCEAGGDGIKLVQFVLGIPFKDALSYLCGDRDFKLDPAEADRRRREAENKKAKQEKTALALRNKSIADARKVWDASVPAAGTIAQEYLARRGITAKRLPKLHASIKFHSDLPYMVPADRGWQCIHRGPAMVAGIQGLNNQFLGVHRTWIDLDQPKGKVILEHGGKSMPAKKVMGSKKGGSIRLSTPKGASTMVTGEGIETTYTAMIAGSLPEAAFWCGVDLGNMAGRRITGKGKKFAGLPDMSDDQAWLPPAWVERLIFLKDGDSEPRLTQAKLESGLRRAMASVPGLRGQIVDAGGGKDLNDLLMNFPEDLE